MGAWEAVGRVGVATAAVGREAAAMGAWQAEGWGETAAVGREAAAMGKWEATGVTAAAGCSDRCVCQGG